MELEDITDEGGTITIHDSGKGMDANEINNGWLVLGQSSKSIKEITPLGRTPAGSKGLGRLAALRMGNTAYLRSVPKSNLESEFQLTINWPQFDSADIVENVQLPITHNHLPGNLTHGSTISIRGLKQRISERDVRKIARGLILLADPFDDDPAAFKPILRSPEFQEMEVLVSKRYFSDADYHLFASVDQTGHASARVMDYLGQTLFEATHEDILGKGNTTILNCPATTFDLWSFILNSTMFTSRTNSITEIRDWLKDFGGVHLYQNGLRVNPYGNPGNDWLNMNLSRARSPEERPSTNNSIGVVRVSDSEGLLSQKTDRAGFIESDVFHEIRIFCQAALDWMAKERIGVAEFKRQKNRQKSSSAATETRDRVQQSISKLNPADREEIEELFNKYDKATQAEVKVLKAEVQLYRTLSTAGITAATFSHESRGNPLKVITQAINAIDRRTKEYFPANYEAVFAKPIQSILNGVRSLEVLGTATLKLLSHEKRRITRVDVHNVISNVRDMFAPFFEGRDIVVEEDFAAGHPYFRSSEAAFESIITNLFNNSIAALENSTAEQRRILIQTVVQENIVKISVHDNGPGITGINVKDIWLPGETTNPNGTGLGLTIVRDATTDLGGSVFAIENSLLGGAEIGVELPIIGI